MSLYFLTIEQVISLHKSVIDVYGGTHGLRDSGLLESALSMPQSSFGGQFLHTDIFEMAAAYLFHIVKNHPLLDGNKRVGSGSAVIFLAVNNVQIENDEAGLVELTLSVAKGEAGKPEIAEFFRSRRIDAL